MNLVKLQVTKLIHRNLLHFYTLMTKDQKEKLRKQSHLPGCLETCWAGPRPSYPQLLLRQVTAVVDATVHGHKALEGRPVSDVGVVEAGVEHDDGEGQDVAGVCGARQRSESWAWPCPLLRPNPSGAESWLSQCPEGAPCPPCLAFKS